MSISQSVEEQVLCIGATRSKSLCQAVIDRIDDIVRCQNGEEPVGLSKAEKAAICEKNSLEISWAPTPSDTPRLVKNALLQAYVDKHRAEPGYRSKNSWVPGVEKYGKKPVVVANPEWSDWHKADRSVKGYLPLKEEGGGVYRVRVAKP